LTTSSKTSTFSIGTVSTAVITGLMQTTLDNKEIYIALTPVFVSLLAMFIAFIRAFFSITPTIEREMINKIDRAILHQQKIVDSNVSTVADQTKAKKEIVKLMQSKANAPLAIAKKV
jgi:hypothetical protein